MTANELENVCTYVVIKFISSVEKGFMSYLALQQDFSSLSSLTICQGVILKLRWQDEVSRKFQRYSDSSLFSKEISSQISKVGGP